MKWVALTFFFIPLLTFAQAFNAGFVQGLWYSEETFFAEEPIRVYVAIRNNTGEDLTGVVEFFDNEKRIGKSTVSALDGRIIESWVDWTPSYGEHTISAEIVEMELHSVGAETETIEVRSAVAEDVLFVDRDTDGDGVGDQDDRDDDGDGVSDRVEQKNGTDPLEYDEPLAEPEEDRTSSNETNETDDGAATDEPVGLEQYLTPSRADHMLSSVTGYTQELKAKLDDYRQARAAKNSETTEPEEITVNADGFGEITRTDNNDTKREKPAVEKPDGFIGDLFGFIGSIFGGIYTGVLAVLSWTLAYPILIQLILLFGILFVLYKVAKRLGGRPV